MTEILFRGKTENGKWIEGNLIYGQNGETYISVIKNNPINKHGDYWYLDTPTYNVIRKTIVQFTGLLDKNGNKIFEGDVLKCIEPNSGKEYITDFNVNFVNGISFNSKKLRRELYLYDNEYPDSWEIIGNIHDNPELLEDEK